jgi:hypothetical protein
VGDFKNSGQEWRPKGDLEEVRVHDFVDPELGRATPYGIYDLGCNHGWVSAGMDHDTAEFAVETIRRWWRSMGQPTYPQATRLLITADARGSNGSRLRLWKLELQKLADETTLRVVVCHFPRVPASGTRSSIGSSPISARTGAASLSAASRLSSVSLPQLPLQLASGFMPR